MKVRRTAEIVKAIMEKQASTRDSDYYLYGFYLNECGYSMDIPFRKLYELVSADKIASIETIGRCRRKVQELYPELQGTKKIQNRRSDYQSDFIELALDKRV